MITRSLNERGITGSTIEGVRHLSASVRHAVEDDIAAVADGFLDFDLGSVLVSGWRKYTELTAAAERTLAVPGSIAKVILKDHNVSSTHHPSVELLIDDIKAYTLVFELTVKFELTGVVAVVRRGELVALRGGECAITVTFTFEGVPLVPQQKKSIDLAIVLPLRPTIPLVRKIEARQHSAVSTSP